MILQPANLAELTTLIADAHARGEKISAIDLGALNRVLDHKAEDMTATVEAGVTLAELQKQLATRGQWLPVDPPNSGTLSIGDLLSQNLSGPRRFGCGVVRDYLIGVKVVLADGQLISSGGKVVKNVAGYDLGKLFIGARGSLGIIVEATFRLNPLPETEKFAQIKCGSLDDAGKLIEAVLDSELTPVVFDLHNLSTGSQQPTLILGFAGTREEVEWQFGKANELGVCETASLDYEKVFWAETTAPEKLSVLPSKLIETIRELKNAPFVARAGNGIIYFREDRTGSPLPAALGDSAGAHGVTRPTLKLEQRLKSEFDPKHILPDLPL
jgi:FAD/FMN-containing dehydrogenase